MTVVVDEVKNNFEVETLIAYRFHKTKPKVKPTWYLHGMYQG